MLPVSRNDHLTVVKTLIEFRSDVKKCLRTLRCAVLYRQSAFWVRRWRRAPEL